MFAWNFSEAQHKTKNNVFFSVANNSNWRSQLISVGRSPLADPTTGHLPTEVLLHTRIHFCQAVRALPVLEGKGWGFGPNPEWGNAGGKKQKLNEKYEGIIYSVYIYIYLLFKVMRYKYWNNDGYLVQYI